MQTEGNIFIVAAASGTGKTSLDSVLVESLNNIMVSISHTTRPMRPGEREGEHYFFITDAEFNRMIKENQFLEYAKVFGYYYGTSRQWVEDKIKNGMDVILEIDWQGATSIKKIFPNSISIFILPPSMQELRRRIENRKQDSEVIIEKRLLEAHAEISHCNEFDYIVINDKFDIALVDLRSIIRSHRLLAKKQLTKQQQLLSVLLK